jgi:hypothetical protein
MSPHLMSIQSWITLGTGFTLAAHFAAAAEPRHYVFFNRERERIQAPAFLAAKGIEGAQIKYTWRELETEPDRYDFAKIQHDLERLRAHGRRLFG